MWASVVVEWGLNWSVACGIFLDQGSKRVDRIEFSKEPEPVPSTSGMSEISACSPTPVADDPLALPSPASSASSSQ